MVDFNELKDKVLGNEDLMKTVANIKIPAGIVEKLKEKGIDVSEDELKKLLAKEDAKGDGKSGGFSFDDILKMFKK